MAWVAMTSGLYRRRGLLTQLSHKGPRFNYNKEHISTADALVSSLPFLNAAYHGCIIEYVNITHCLQYYDKKEVIYYRPCSKKSASPGD